MNTFFITEFNFGNSGREDFNNSTDLSTDKPVFRNVLEKSDHGQEFDICHTLFIMQRSK